MSHSAKLICASAYFAELTRKADEARPAAFRRNPQAVVVPIDLAADVAATARDFRERLRYAVGLNKRPVVILLEAARSRKARGLPLVKVTAPHRRRAA